MIKIYLLDKKSNLKPETHKEYICLPNSFLEIRKEAVKIYKWLKAIEQRHIQKLYDQKYSLGVDIINQSKNEQGAAVFLESIFLLNYRFDKYQKLKKNRFNISFKNNSLFKKEIVEGVFLARDLVNEPLSFLTATQLSKEIKKASKNAKFNLKVLGQKQIQSLGMGGVLSVNRGSVNPPTFNILSYLPKKNNQKPIILVGKGVVYDTGGLSLKPTPNSMDCMKSDMGGAAAVIGAIYAISKMKLNVNVIGLIPAVENRPGGNAYVPGDVVTMMDGSSVEVLNTDAEGRMILADALHYAKGFDPKLVLDVATLTGSAARAVGKYGIVAMGNASKKICDIIEKSGHEMSERVAFQPFWDEYSQELESNIADLKNIGSAEAGHITAGKFLEHFTKDAGKKCYPWIHLDIAGSAFLQSEYFLHPKGGTGSGVRLICRFLQFIAKNGFPE